VIAGRYTLDREIGRGGMGAVWLGQDTVLGREVALKRVGWMPGASSPDAQRAEREARLAARLNHPHVVAVFDLVEDGEETWLVMEHVEGVTLAALVNRDGALTPDEAAALIRQAADALAAAHAAGIIHRDVKPSNMMVTTAGEVKLTDFGIARTEADASLTRTGLVTGSPAYLAPEVASGASATEAADVWALGATLFHLLAGRPPYDVTENVMGALYKIVHEEPPRFTPAGWLTPVLEHTMARRPGDRWSMAQVRDFLDRGRDVTIHPTPLDIGDPHATRVLLATPADPVAAPPDPAVPAPAHRRSRWPWVAAAVIAVVAVIAYVALAGGGGRTPTADRTGSSTAPSSHRSTSTTGDTGSDRSLAMQRFLDTYLSTLTSDRRSAWAMLTRPYQAASGGYAGYSGFWRTIRSAIPSNVTVDPSAMTVTYDVAYVKTDGEHSIEHHTLQLVRHGSSYLINDQLS